MTSDMQRLDENMKTTEVEQRKKFLIMNLKAWHVYENDAGISLDNLRLAELEWIWVSEKNKAARAYGES